MSSPVLKVTACALSAVGAAAVTSKVSSDEGAQRSLEFWKNIFPIYVQYRYVQLLHRDLGVIAEDDADRRYKELHERYSNPIRDLTYRMRGFYLKQAQLMSTQNDFVPEEYMRWVKDTQDKVPSEFGPGEARAYYKHVFHEETGLHFDDIFDYFEDEPIGVASIGEVHRARLRSTGEAVAIKIQFPGMERRFRADIRTLKTFCKLAMPQHVTAFDEIEKQFCTEFDYTGEARNLTSLRDLILPRWGSLIAIPKPYPEYTTKHILVMEYLDGLKLVDGIRENGRRVAQLTGKSFEQIEAERRIAFMNGTMNIQTLDQYHREALHVNTLLTLSDMFLTANPLRFLYNYSPLALFYGTIPYYHTERPIDLSQVLKVLCEVHGDQIFSGMFNGDPHPGNILLLSNNKLGLIDYGQVKTFTEEERVKYAKLIIALSRNDGAEVVRLMKQELGLVTKYGKDDITLKFSQFWNDRDTPDVCGDMNVYMFIEWMEKQDPMVSLPEGFIFASRVSVMLRGMGKAFGLKIHMTDYWKARAEQYLQSRGITY